MSKSEGEKSRRSAKRENKKIQGRRNPETGLRGLGRV